MTLAAMVCASLLAAPFVGAASKGVWEQLRRPLHVPKLPPGAPCPRALGRQVSPDIGLAYGKGPAYAVLGVADGLVHFGGARREGGWWYVKVLWVVNPAHKGPVLIRGRQVDGRNGLRFEFGSSPPRELRIPRWGRIDSGWGQRP